MNAAPRSSRALALVSPPPLRAGGHVRVIAPSSPFDLDDFERGVARLRARYRVTYAAEIGARRGYLAGDDERRRGELARAIDDPDVDVILAARGGYGAMRIASSIDPARIAARPALLVGFSDVTALHALWARAGVCSLHASMAGALGRVSDAALARWIATVEGAPLPAITGLEPLGEVRGVVEGPLLGGNLAVLAAMIGTPLAPSLDGSVLFLEDVGEAPYRLDRMLTQLLLSGALDGVSGVLLGTFTRCEAAADGTTALDVLAERLAPLGIPVLSGIAAGHGPEPLELPFGSLVRVDADAGFVTFLREPLASMGRGRNLRSSARFGAVSPSRGACVMDRDFSLAKYDITVKNVVRNAPPAQLYEAALRNEAGTAISSTGALIAISGEKTGRSPKDKRIVDEPASHDNIWWGDVNIGLDPHVFAVNHERATDYLNTHETIYVVDGYAGWDERYRLKIRVICSRAYHALFMHNMLIRPSAEELAKFGEPDYVILNAGEFSANRYTSGMTSKTSVALNFAKKEFVILGTEYAGEMKKGVFTIMNYLMPLQGQLSMHCSANEGDDGNTSIFFGLSGTGKTTLSADPRRKLIGDDEHVWTENGVFNIEGGCYAKAINLSAEQEPEIFGAIRFGAVLENVKYDADTRKVDYEDTSITENTRCAYPIEFIDNAKIPCLGGHPTNVIMLTADAFGVLPPVAKLTPEQAMYHFISGYTAKVAGTEVGVKEPSPTFSACFGGPFLVWHPTKYAELLAEKLKKTGAQTWLVNTGWTGGAYGVGKRMSLKHTRAIIDAIHDGTLAKAPTAEDPVFGFQVPTQCAGVPGEILAPRTTWQDKATYDATAKKLAKFFVDNFKKYESQASDAIRGAGPKL